MTISIIIPVYNASQYLSNCIDSIISQTYQDIELILIDDGSTDNSGEICDSYAKEDSKIIVQHKLNGGVSSARNLGLSIARGEYITFVDSDDYLKKDYLKNLLNASLKYDADLVQAGFQKCTESCVEEVKCTSIDFATSSIDEILKHLRGFCCSKLFRNSVIRENQLTFDEELTLAEDLCFVLKYCEFAKRIAFIHNTDYCYLTNQNSASSKLHKPNALLKEWILESQLLDRLITPHNIGKAALEWKSSIGNNVLTWIISMNAYEAKSPIDKEIVKKIKDHYNDYALILSTYESKSKLKNIIVNLLLNKYYRLASLIIFIVTRIKRYDKY